MKLFCTTPLSVVGHSYKPRVIFEESISTATFIFEWSTYFLPTLSKGLVLKQVNFDH